MAEFKDRLQEAMDARGLVAADLVEQSGITKGAMSKYLRGLVIPKFDALDSIAKALNVNPLWLMGRNGEPMENGQNKEAQEKIATAKVKDRLRTALDARGMKSIDLAYQAGVTRGTISRYIHGSITPKRDAIDNLAGVLNVNPAWLMGYDAPMERTIDKNENEDEKGLLSAFRKMNTRNKLKLIGYAEALASDDENGGDNGRI